MIQSYAGSFYGTTVAARMLQQPTVVLYIPIVKNLSRPEFDEYMDAVSQKIEFYHPKRLVSIDKDFLSYLPTDIQEKYKNAYLFIQTFQPMCEKINFLVESADRKNVPLYILLGTQSISRDSDDVVSSCIKSDHEVFYIQTLQQLKKTLVELQAKGKGFIISGLNYVVDEEFNTVIDRGQVNHYINMINREHTTIGKFSYINLDIALRPVYQDSKLYVELFVRPENLKSEDEQILMKNILPTLDGTLSR
ncbi:hypothetical protein JA13_088 [Dickeya phage vB_DsoM_JA13]|uniref:Uncharacterized protein n=1 Tax=Dickeya phage vB_DsoM_JA13 TaxID=2283030 RepID=A0A384ZW66_9CAUD|nr:hypothetical protein JA13_088 [Dickeya phage vB_DsoM_JA13]